MQTIPRKPASSSPSARQRAASAKLAAIKRESLEQWRAWAKAMSNGGPSPDAVQIMSIGAILGIDSPLAQLARDAEAVAEFDQCQKNVGTCRGAVAEKLAEFGGKPEAIDAAIARMEAEIVRLRAIRNEIEDGCSEPYWTARAHELRRSAPLALGYDDESSAA